MANGNSLLLVDVDDVLRESLREQLQLNEEFEIEEASNGLEALQMARTSNHDLLILDAGLPDMGGLELCRLMRAAGVDAPIIMMIGADTEATAIVELSSGVDDYVTKPFKLSVLLELIRAQLRQQINSGDIIINIGPYSFLSAAKMLIDTNNDSRKIRLTEKESAILKYLFYAREAVIGRDVLLNEIWGYNSGVTTHTLETHVYRLRQKIEHDPSNAKFLVTEPGGYRLLPQGTKDGPRGVS
jgi:DNA-binding response OmpR family regulator